ncbi:ABC transporter permease [Komagataeibacter rhaeticus]|uniref:ABC transporter permease n=1 Tax=Komagataeibacter rhaeticus TaxID=215221 RepID=UPI0004D80FC3|nr:ABC transporter permease [Komagataeibacter rhaeticus]KDU95098.1 ABC transporter permease [Komagataeibacter rhaeticus AF1]MBL7238702.1 ABC transporter permease [Komagataeibacter rhaeticus]PYD53011.1 ABC transporter permease [Komagataeibacter rhaeticus]GBQ09178.1 nitrate/sulfonate/bicarbonate ABC transporter permease [Komagataeibacter rhaeticus DSM 16663]
MATPRALTAVFSSPRALSPVVLLVLLAAWEGAVRALHVPAIVLPAPSAVVQALWLEIRSGTLWPHFLVTCEEILAGFGIGAIVGIGLGVLIGQSRFLEQVFYPYLVAAQTIPKVAIAPILVIWLGYGLSSKIVITATIAFFPALSNTIVGLQATPREQMEMLRACTATQWQIFCMARFPQALPYIFAGLDVAAVLSVIGAIVGEFVGARAGLGYLILQMNFSFDMAGVFSILLVLCLIGICLHLAVGLVRRRVLFWTAGQADPLPGL